MGRKKRTDADDDEGAPPGQAELVAPALPPLAAPAVVAATPPKPAGGMPQLLPPTKPGMPQLMPANPALAPTPANVQQLAALMEANPQLAVQIVQNPLLAGQLLRHAQAVNQTTQQINGEVQELADHFGLDERITRQLDTELRKRENTFAGDVQALYEILETARNPPGLLAVKIREMQEGTFIGEPVMDKNIKEFKKLYDLDEQAVRKLAEILPKRVATKEQDIDLLHRHLETSNKPSARIMMMLSQLRSGEKLPEPDKRIAPGSYLDRKQKEEREKDRERRDDRDRRDRRSRSRRRRSRSRSRSRDRDRDRDRDRRR
eukprot:TRINITY_DN6585_c0_g1_i1.p1 TRINITY_DN6585_c0_g1~~TRINITY_DN6585_c0_g1_i1.p1  ORF type:complete len:318 (+),score=64.03 TRINITY_DN6585_c0_g1_i1:156-1109(+)